MPKGRDYPILETTGRGQFVGTFLSVMANSDGWWGEGNDKFYVDGAEKPTIEGTGSEDYFCGAWDFQHAFFNPYNGVPLYTNKEKGGRKAGNSQYLLSLAYPRPGSVHQIAAADDRAWPQRLRTTIASRCGTITPAWPITIWTSSEGDGPALPAYKDRVPQLLPLPEAAK